MSGVGRMRQGGTIEQAFTGEIPFEEIPQVMLDAQIAAEDQNFASHHGFDFNAIEKARAHNERMLARAQKRNAPVKRLRASGC